MSIWIILAMFVLIKTAAGAAMSGGQCPEEICSSILLPESCKPTTSYLLHKGRMCRQCDICLDRDTPTDTEGCPILKCPPLTFTPGCISGQYFLWNNRLCPDCDVNTCQS